MKKINIEKILNIGFDIDGVLNDIEKFQLEEGFKYFRKKYINSYYKKHGILLKNSDVKDSDIIVDRNGYGIKEIFGCTEEEEVAFWTKYTPKFFFEPAKENMATLIHDLRAKGNKIYIISSRALTTEDSKKGQLMRFLVEQWLKRNNIEYDEIVYCSTKNSSIDKVEACKKYNIDVIVEDNKENVEALNKVTNVICFHTKNNEGYSGENTHYAYNYDDVGKAINEIHAQKILKVTAEEERINNTFKILNREEREKLSHDNLISYYKDLKTYYANIPFDKNQMLKFEKQCINVLKVLQPVFNAYYKPKVLNKNVFPSETGVIYASNHLHSYDPLLILNSVKNVSFHLLAKSELLDEKIGELFKYIGSVFVDNNDYESKQQAKEEIIKILLHGGNTMQFPEGTRNRREYNRYMLDFKYGVVDIAQITGAPIIPFAINDNYSFRSSGLFVNIGEPMYVKPEDDLTVANIKLRDTIATLLWEIIVQESLLTKTKNQKRLSL